MEKGKADFHMPYITPMNPQRIPFQYGADVLFKAIFALYAKRNNKEINHKNAAKYKVETDEGAKYVFEFYIPNIAGSPSIESSLQKVDVGRIDA